MERIEPMVLEQREAQLEGAVEQKLLNCVLSERWRPQIYRGLGSEVKAALESAQFSHPFSRYKHICIHKPFILVFYCGGTIFPDCLIWPLSVIQNPEDIKIKEEQKQTEGVMKLSVLW